MEEKTLKIPSKESDLAIFYDDYGNDTIYYSQRLVFKIKIDGQIISCYAEYTYDDDEPYAFSFH